MPEQGQSIAQADAKRDGLLIQDEAVDNSCEIMCSDELPTVRLQGIKDVDGNQDPVCPVIDVQDDNGQTKVAIFDTGLVTCETVACNLLVPKDGDEFAGIKVKNIQAGAGSVWLGDKLHLSESSSRAQLQYRKDTIPVYLQQLGVDAGDVSGIGKTIAT